MKLLSLFLIILTFVSFSGCDDYALDPGFTSPFPQDSSSTDNFIKLEFKGRIWTDQSNWQFPTNDRSYITNFNKLNYPNAETILFAAVLNSISFGNICYAELYNVTDSVSISNSFVQSNSRDWVEIRSSDIIDSLPEKNITLTFRVRSEHKGIMVSAAASNYIYIFESK